MTHSVRIELSAACHKKHIGDVLVGGQSMVNVTAFADIPLRHSLGWLRVVIKV